MPSIAEMARVRTARPVGIEPDSFMEKGWLVWLRLHAMALGSNEATRDTNGRGVLFPVNVKAVMRDLFPEAPWDNPDDEHGFVVNLYQVLRRTNSAYVVRRNVSGPYLNEWFIADEFSPNGTTVNPATRSATLTPTRTERRLTPAEAGEDRPAAPVTVTRTASSPVAARVGPKSGALRNTEKPDARARAERTGVPSLYPQYTGAKDTPWKCPVCPRVGKTGQAIGAHITKHYNEMGKVLAAANRQPLPMPKPESVVKKTAAAPMTPSVAATDVMVSSGGVMQFAPAPVSKDAETLALVREAVMTLPMPQAMARVMGLVTA